MEIVKRLEALRDAKVSLSLASIRGVILAVILSKNPEILEAKFGDGSTFRCSDEFTRKWLHSEMGWSERRATRDAQKLPVNWEELCLKAFYRIAYCVKEHDIPSGMIVNTDQTQVVYAPGSKLTWTKKGSKQVSIVGLEEKRAITLVVSVANDGQLLPFQAVYTGLSNRSRPSIFTDKYQEAQQLGFHFDISGNTTYWSTMATMKILVNDIISVHFSKERAKLGLSNDHKAIWQIDAWSVHRSLEFREWMANNHPNIVLQYVPAGCTGVFQACDVGIQRILKHSLKRSHQRDVVDDVLEQLQEKKEKLELHRKVGELRNASVKWLWEAYHVINKPEIVLKVSINYLY